MDKVIRYQVWYGFDHGDLVNDYNDALKEAIENDGDEIEELIWDSEKSYEEYKPADQFKIVWRKGCM